MEGETIRILIASIASIISAMTTALFGYSVNARREKLLTLEKRLVQTLKQFRSLYRVEKLYLEELERLLGKPKSEIKIEFRRRVYNNDNTHITLTDTEANKQIERLE